MSNIQQYPVVSPDAVYSPTGEEREPWEDLNPCPVCDSTPFDAPEGTDKNGNPVWVFEHCWKCGHRPGVNQAISQNELRRQFEAFKQYVADNTPEHATLNPPADQSVIDDLTSRMEAMQAEMAAMRGSGAEKLQGPAPNTPSTTKAAPRSRGSK